MRIAIAQINSILGNFQKNSEKIIEYIQKASERHCDLVVFPESCLFGYHPFDLLEREELVNQQLDYISLIEKSIPKNLIVVIGAFTKNKNKKGRLYYNSAVVLEKGKKAKYFHKQLLPTGDVFDEARFIQSGNMCDNYFSIKGKKIFLTICEDIWAWPIGKKRSIYDVNPIENIKSKNVDLVLNLSASPYYPGKLEIRKTLVKKTAKHLCAPMIYCNLVGAQDEIIFDGTSFALDQKGKLLSQCLSFEEDLAIVDLSKKKGNIHAPSIDLTEELRQALVLGIRDFCFKSGLKKVHLGLSGGIDSALVACLAVDALGPANVVVFALPSQFNSPLSLSLAERLAQNLKIQLKKISIQNIYSVLRKTIDTELEIDKFSVVHENLQARIRGLILMAYANYKNSLLLATSNKSEMATGYSTLYGDMCGGLAPIGDLTKTQVYELCRYYNQSMSIIPEEIISRPPSAELRPDQKDQDTLPPYSLLDDSVNHLVENGCRKITKTDEWLLPVLFKTEFKRWQSAPILKISKHSFGRGRRFPIAHQAVEN